MRWQRFRNLYAEDDQRRRRPWMSLIVMVVLVKAVFWLTAWLSGGHWQLACMAAVAAVLVLLLFFVVLLRGLRASGSPLEHDAESPPARPAEAAGRGEQREAAESVKPEADGEADALADRYYFKGAWFTVVIHPEDQEGHRIDLTGPLCPQCHELMLRARDREPMEKLGEERTEAYKCHKSALHSLVSVQLSGPDDLPEQARSNCLHEIATGQFSSTPVEDGGSPGGEGTGGEAGDGAEGEPDPGSASEEDAPPV